MPAQTLNVDLSTISAATDVALGFGFPFQEVVDLNFQSGPDPNVPSRLHLYNAAFHLRFQVPVRSVLILLRPKADAGQLTGRLAYACGGKRVEFEYDIIYQGVRVMHESTAYDMAVEEGCVKTSHRFLLTQGRKLLGRPEPSIESALTSIQDLERLERMGEAILTAKSWEELLSTL